MLSRQHDVETLNAKVFYDEGAESILCEAKPEIGKTTAHVVSDSALQTFAQVDLDAGKLPSPISAGKGSSTGHCPTLMILLKSGWSGDAVILELQPAASLPTLADLHAGNER